MSALDAVLAAFALMTGVGLFFGALRSPRLDLPRVPRRPTDDTERWRRISSVPPGPPGRG